MLSLLTGKRVHGFLGQDGGLQGQLTDAELTGEGQVSQVTVTPPHLLQTTNRTFKKGSTQSRFFGETA